MFAHGAAIDKPVASTIDPTYGQPVCSTFVSIWPTELTAQRFPVLVSVHSTCWRTQYSTFCSTVFDALSATFHDAIDTAKCATIHSSVFPAKLCSFGSTNNTTVHCPLYSAIYAAKHTP